MLIKHRGKVVDTATGEVYSRRVGYTRKRGYYAVYLAKGVTQQAHRFIWEAVHGPIPEGMVINHINGIKTDNRLANLECVTQSRNTKPAFETGLAVPRLGERHHHARLTNIQVLAIRALAGFGISHTEIASRLLVSRSTVSMIVRRQTWTHLPALPPARIEDM